MGLYLQHHSSLLHETGEHPENANRIRAIEAVLDAAGWAGLERLTAPRAERAWLERVHTPAHLDALERLCSEGGGAIDADTITVEASWEAALRAAGAAASGAERLLAGEDRFAFCAMRPPGHHAESDRAMGFCLLNNAAVAAAHAIDACGVGRVLILDWDVHHGNGTAEIFDRSPEVLYASIHQSPLYPGTGHPHAVGAGAGEGYTLNLPVPPGAGGEDFRALLEHVVAPIAREFAPGLLVISAGYDAHADDPLANCALSAADYAELTAVMRDLGTELSVPLLFCLEGGYELEALADSVHSTLLAMLASEPAPPAPIGPARNAIDALTRFWPAALAAPMTRSALSRRAARAGTPASASESRGSRPTPRRS